MKALFCGLAGLMVYSTPALAEIAFKGVNLAGAEFSYPAVVPGVESVNYFYPTQAEVGYYLGKGMNTFRLPFLWERLQPDLNAGFDAAELGRLTSFVDQATAAGAHVVLDPHDYGQYLVNDAGVRTPFAIGSAEVSTTQFANFWGQLAGVFADNSKVMFGLMNEPVGTPVITTETWFGAAQEAVNAIRAAGAANPILVPGNYYTGAWSWVTGNGNGTPNAEVLATYGLGGLDDPGVDGSGKNLLYEVHQYLDLNPVTGFSFSGTWPTIDYSASAVLADFTNWLRDTGNRGFLAEFGVSTGPAQAAAISEMLGHLEANNDVWEGWTWWAGGPQWGDYMLSLEPVDGVDAPQMAYLEPFLAVPEPGTWALLAGAGLVFFVSRRLARRGA